MKKLLVVCLLVVSGLVSHAQTAVNFTCNDCNGVSHTLFDELDAGKIVVICWVMPCGTCLIPAKAAYDMVGTYQTTHPNRVLYYLADDYANTTCAYLDDWANTSGMPDTVYMYEFSNSVIKMSDYGLAGMPKTVVLGTNGHNVFYNVNNTVDTASLHHAIDSALALASVDPTTLPEDNFSLYPNPAGEQVSIRIHSGSIQVDKIEITDESGKILYSEFLMKGNSKNEISVPVKDLKKGMYLVRIYSGKAFATKKMLKK